MTLIALGGKNPPVATVTFQGRGKSFGHIPAIHIFELGNCYPTSCGIQLKGVKIGDEL